MSDFWSKRKAAVEAATDAELAEAHEATLEASTAEKTDAEILDELGLPDPDNMKEGDDFSAFMNDLVPARLKTRALRKLWRLNPLLANVDGLVDYGEDFTDAAMVIENMQTTYQVGKGMMAHVKELARQALEKEEGVQDVPAKAAEDEELTIEELIAADVDEEAPESTVVALADDDAEPEIAPSPPTHRMQFQFEDQHTA
ncbi:MAG: hypothetical protein ACI9PU_001691 [Ascidiaceihabitans sp.]|jgi:hypothetical protein|tara:strand:- start:368 stop:967 length:600 start_codon:yes stop_codon:yes gene_type:complete